MKYIDLELRAPSPVFTRQDLLLMGLKVHDAQLSQWVRKGYLVRLKNGIYAFARGMDQLRGEHVAFLLYQPSYFSLECARCKKFFMHQAVASDEWLVDSKNNMLSNDRKYFGLAERTFCTDLMNGVRGVSEAQ